MCRHLNGDCKAAQLGTSLPMMLHQSIADLHLQRPVVPSCSHAGTGLALSRVLQAMEALWISYSLTDEYSVSDMLGRGGSALLKLLEKASPFWQSVYMCQQSPQALWGEGVLAAHAPMRGRRGRAAGEWGVQCGVWRSPPPPQIGVGTALPPLGTSAYPSPKQPALSVLHRGWKKDACMRLHCVWKGDRTSIGAGCWRCGGLV